MDSEIVGALSPVLLLLACGVATILISQMTRVSPVVGYLGLGLGLKSFGWLPAGSGTVKLLAELGVVFLLFDIGLHFSLKHIRGQASDIFLFGPTQVAFATLALGGVAWATGLPSAPALLLGAVLALSSTAVVAPLIAQRHQRSCPVGLTATAILVFQDVAAIFLLVVTGAGDMHQSVFINGAVALAKAAAAVSVAVLSARYIVRPILTLMAKARHEEAFTTMALLIALTAAWASARAGLSLTLGAFLGGMALAETPYRAIIQSEIKPFRGLLLGFFFISVGLSFDLHALMWNLPFVAAAASALIVVKVVTNAAASLVFRWSVPGSMQLGFLIAQGSEFAFVILALPAVRDSIGQGRAAIATAAVAISLALTPNVAAAGRFLASRLRARVQKIRDQELERREAPAPVLIVGMGRAGRTLADALMAFDIGYVAIERDQKRLGEAVADGYVAMFGDMSDSRIWASVVVGRKISALTAPIYDVSVGLSAMARQHYPDLLRVALTKDETEAERFRDSGLRAVVDRSFPPGLDLAAAVLAELAVEPDKIADWMRLEQDRSFGGDTPAAFAAA